MTFKDATDRLFTLGINAADLAERIGVRPNTVRVARLEPDTASYRRPPDGWRAAAAALARERGEALLRLADDLER